MEPRKDMFFTRQKCDRCGGSLQVRTMSWFNEQTICMDCSGKEDALKERMRQIGMNPRDYEGTDKSFEEVATMVYATMVYVEEKLAGAKITS